MYRNLSLRILSGVLLFSITAMLSAQSNAGSNAGSNAQLSGSISLFGGDSAPPVFLESERGWTLITAFDLQQASILSPEEGALRRWRLETSYEHARTSGPVTLQIRLRGAEGDPVFTHPWSEGADRMADAYSNWFEDAALSLAGSGKGYLEARLIAPPRTPMTGKLFSISIEAWDRNETLKNRGPAGPAVQLAYARPLPTSRMSSTNRADADAENPEVSAEAALQFSLTFIESCLIGDLPAYYRAQADPVRSLDDGKAMPRYRLTPPGSIPGTATLDDYRRRFDYTIRPASDLKELFPEWFDENRPWVPGENAYLFMGHRDRLGGIIPSEVDYLVFLVEPDSEGSWKVVARPGN